MYDLIFSEPLSSQSCTNCYRYLSVGPLMFLSDGSMICGRCSNNIGTGLKQSLYNLVAERMIFRCIGYYSGCKELLFFNEPIQHEPICGKITDLQCPFCEFSSNGCALNNHFTKEHAEYVQRPGFPPLTIQDNMSKKIVVTENQCMLAVHVHVGPDVVQIFNLLITYANHIIHFKFKLKFHGEERILETPVSCVNGDRHKFNLTNDLNAEIIAPKSDVLYRAMMNNCFPSGSCNCQVVLLLESDYVGAPDLEKDYFILFRQEVDKLVGETTDVVPYESRKIPDLYFEVIPKIELVTLMEIMSRLESFQLCANCKIYISTEVYVCPKYHLACDKCSWNKCPQCKKFCQWNKKSKLHSISVPCHSDGCDEHTNIFNFMEHKRDCEYRKYQCPDIDCQFKGCLDCLQQHWHLIEPLVEENIMEVLAPPNFSAYWIKYGELFRVGFNFINVDLSRDYSGLLVRIDLVDVVMLKGYKYELSHSETENGPALRLIPYNLYSGEIQGQTLHYLQAKVNRELVLNLEIVECF